MSKLVKVLSSLVIVGSLVTSPIVSEAAVTKSKQSQQTAKLNAQLNTVRNQVIQAQNLFLQYVNSEGKDISSIYKLEEMIKVIPNPDSLTKLGNSKQAFAIVHGYFLIADYVTFGIEMATIDIQSTYGEPDEALVEKSRRKAGELLHSLNLFNNDLKSLKLKTIPNH